MENQYFTRGTLNFDTKKFEVNCFFGRNFDINFIDEYIKNIDSTIPIYISFLNLNPQHLFKLIARIHTNTKLILVRCNFTTRFIVENIESCEIDIDECTLFKNEITAFKSSNIKLSIYNIKNPDHIRIFNCHDVKTQLKQTAFKGAIVENSSNIVLSNIDHLTEFNLISMRTDSLSLSFKNVKIGTLNYDQVRLQSIKFDQCTSDRDIFLLNSFINNRQQIIDEIFIHKCNFTKLHIQSQFMSKIINKLSIISTDNVTISQIEVNNLKLELTNKRLKIANCRIGNINFTNFISCEENSISAVTIDNGGELKITNSILKGLETNPSFLHKFSNLYIKNSSIEGIEIYNFQEINDNVIINSRSDPEDMIAFCRELVSLMNKQNHKYYAANYNALEQNLRLKAGIYRTNADKIILRLNSLSNEHGTKPEKALALIGICLFVYWWILGYELHFHHYERVEYSAFKIMANNLPVFFNPLKGVKDITFLNYTPSKLMIAFDTLYNITYAYLVYQFIAAFRKLVLP